MNETELWRTATGTEVRSSKPYSVRRRRRRTRNIWALAILGVLAAIGWSLRELSHP